MSARPNVTHCPECGGELESGFVMDGGAINISWQAGEEEKPKVWSQKRQYKLCRKRDVWKWFPHFHGLRCPQCKLILFRYTATQEF